MHNYSDIGTLASGIAHELNNPLAIIHGLSTLIHMELQKEDVNKDKLKENSEKLLNTVNRLDALISNLRYFIKDDKLSPALEVPSSQIVDHLNMFSLENARKKGIEISLVDEIEGKIFCKPHQLSIALINIINNAVDAVSIGGAISINFFKEERKICFKISNSGPAIENVDSLLKIFTTSKSLTKESGLGIGLSIVKRIIDAHKGEIHVSNNPTTFLIKIPEGL